MGIVRPTVTVSAEGIDDERAGMSARSASSPDPSKGDAVA
jgi:hypothetical protein